MENTFYNRINLFLVAESMLFAAYATLATIHNNNTAVTAVLAFLGFVLTLVWSCVSHRSYINLGELSDNCRKEIPEYDKIVRSRESRFIKPTNKILGHYLPSIVLLAWLGLIVLVWV